MRNTISTIDRVIIHRLKKYHELVARSALFIVFFWFGLLKIIAESPANPLINELLQKTLPFVTFNTFIIGFGVYEMVIGALFLIPHLERAAIAFLIPHLIMTSLTLILLPATTWQSFLVPTLEGQYVIKNIVIIALALTIAANLHPMKKNP